MFNEDYFLFSGYSEKIDLQEVTIRLINDDERERFDDLIKKYHYLHSSRMAGEQLRHIAVDGKGDWVALMAWGASSYKLKEREKYIGWNKNQRRQRLKFVVQNRRFLILPNAKMPNLASRVLGLNLRCLSADWYKVYGHHVLLAETFVDPQLYKGTCYKAAGWEQLGVTAGYSRVRMDFYQEHGRAKQLWVKPLHPDFRKILTADQLPDALKCGETDVISKPSAPEIKTPQLESLMKAFQKVPEFRQRTGRRYPLFSLLSMIAVGTLCGANNIEQIAVIISLLSQPQLRALRSWRNPRTGRFEAPKVTTFWRVLHGIESEIFDDVLINWLAQHRKESAKAIAFDGKVLRAAHLKNGKQLQLVTAFSHESEQFLAQETIDEKSNEIPAVQRMLSKLSKMDDVVFTFDALHTQTKTARMCMQDTGAEYIMQIKKNQEGLLNRAKEKLPEISPYGGIYS